MGKTPFHNKESTMRFPITLLGTLLITTLVFTTCDDVGDINIFSVEDDIRLGQQLRDEVLADTSQFDVLESMEYPEAYDFIEGILADILASDDIIYAEEFPWEIYLIENDTALNAFAAPGGYLFVYTGLAKFLEHQDDLAGVIAHEVAHADERHATEQLTQTYGVSFLLDILIGQNREALTDVLGTLLSLQFSRADEEQADRLSVIYLCDTPYAADGAANFFERIEQRQGGASPPEFLSTHPDPADRVSAITSLADERNCDTTYDSDAQAWQAFQNRLP